MKIYEPISTDIQCWGCGRKGAWISLKVCKLHLRCYIKFLIKYKGDENLFLYETSEEIE